MPEWVGTIKRAEYAQDPGQTHHRDENRTGSVQVFYSSGQRPIFEHINRAEFFEWERHKWDWHKPPRGVGVKPPELYYSRSERQQMVLDEIDKAGEIEDTKKRARRNRLRAKLGLKAL